ncbi:MAG: hypothetical protein MJZ84_03370 [Paludibacteraceae bacterium]|nr:hypothetical protein [Paludibacteraceae bacterium]
MKKILTFVLAALASVATFAGTLSCAEAVELAQGLEPNTPSEEEYIVEGYVVSVIKSTATDLRFWMADDANAELGTFEAWVCTGDLVNKGDKVTVTGNIQWYVNQKDESDQKAEISGGVVVVVEPAPIDMNYVEFNSGDFEGKGVSSTGGEISVTKNGVTVYTNAGFGSSYSLRVYKNKQFKISADRRIVSIAFEFDNYDGDYSGGLDPEVCVEGTEWENVMATQGRFKKISVTLGDGACSIVPPVVETITIAQALEIGNALEDGAKTTENYVVEAFVVMAYDFDETYKNQSFYMSDNPTAERGDFFAKYTTGDVVVKGDKVQVKGQIEKYVKDDKTTIQIYKGVATIVSHVGLNDIKAANKANKFFDGKQVVFEVNGVQYNVLGNIVK